MAQHVKIVTEPLRDGEPISQLGEQLTQTVESWLALRPNIQIGQVKVEPMMVRTGTDEARQLLAAEIIYHMEEKTDCESAKAVEEKIKLFGNCYQTSIGSIKDRLSYLEDNINNWKAENPDAKILKEETFLEVSGTGDNACLVVLEKIWYEQRNKT